MLRFLRIRNLAVIEAVEVEFDPGFNVLTGETGAGKSILVEAVGLLLGGRALGRSRPHRRRRGHHRSASSSARTAARCIIRREIAAQGRSRSFVNGALATARRCASVVRRLVELHGQHEHQALLDPADASPCSTTYAGLEPPRPAWRRSGRTVRELRERLGSASMDARERAARLELVAFQLGEIDDRAAGGRARTTSSSRAGTCWRTPSASSGCARRATTSCTTATTRCCAQLAGVWKRVERAGRDRSAFAPHRRRARRRSKRSSRTWPSFLRGYADGVDASPATPAAGRGPAGAARAAEAEVRSGARRRDRDGRGAPGGARARLTGATSERSATSSSSSPRPRRRFLTAARELVGRAAPRPSDVRARASRRCSRSSRWPRRGSRSGSSRPSRARWAGRAAGIDRASSSSRRTRARTRGRWRGSSRAASSRGSCWRCDARLRRPAGQRADRGRKTLIFDEVDAGIGGRVADVVGELLRELGGALPGAVHHPPAADRGARPRRSSRSRSASRGGRTVTVVTRLDRRRARGRDRADDGGSRQRSEARAGERPRAAGRRRRPEGERRTGGERRKRKSGRPRA